MIDDSAKLRVDKWLWYARFFKTRTLAATLCKAGKIRLNGETLSKANRGIQPGDTLTFQAGPHVRVIKVLALGERRGPAPEARTLYQDLAPPPEPQPKPDGALDKGPKQLKPAQRDEGAGRPTKRERRVMDRWNRGDEPRSVDAGALDRDD